MKFFGRKDVAVCLSSELVSLVTQIQDYQSYVLVPIPMPKLRKYIRGYNQSEVLAKHLALHCSAQIDCSLLRRSTAPQRQVSVASRTRRLLNQKGTFVAGDAAGRRIILIDDVTTTGATLMEARTVLLASGALEVRALTLAH